MVPPAGLHIVQMQVPEPVRITAVQRFVHAPGAAVVPHVQRQAEQRAFQQQRQRLLLKGQKAVGILHAELHRNALRRRGAAVPEGGHPVQIRLPVGFKEVPLFLGRRIHPAPGQVHIQNRYSRLPCQRNHVQHRFGGGLGHPTVKIGHVQIVVKMGGKENAARGCQPVQMTPAQRFRLKPRKVQVQLHELHPQRPADGRAVRRCLHFQQRGNSQPQRT